MRLRLLRLLLRSQGLGVTYHWRTAEAMVRLQELINENGPLRWIFYEVSGDLLSDEDLSLLSNALQCESIRRCVGGRQDYPGQVMIEAFKPVSSPPYVQLTAGRTAHRYSISY